MIEPWCTIEIVCILYSVSGNFDLQKWLKVRLPIIMCYSITHEDQNKNVLVHLSICFDFPALCVAEQNTYDFIFNNSYNSWVFRGLFSAGDSLRGFSTECLEQQYMFLKRGKSTESLQTCRNIHSSHINHAIFGDPLTF